MKNAVMIRLLNNDPVSAFVLSLGIFLIFLFPAENARGQRSPNGDVRIDTLVDSDHYLSGRRISVHAPVHGDLFVVCESVVVNDTITQDLLVAAGEIEINGVVLDDVRAVGRRMAVNGSVHGDVLFAGAELVVPKTSIIYGNLVCAGGEIHVEGTVLGSIRNYSRELYFSGLLRGGLESTSHALTIDGPIEGPCKLSGDKIVIASGARFNDAVEYWSQHNPVDFKSSITNGLAVFKPGLEPERPHWYYLGFSSLLLFVWYIVTGLVVLLVLQFFLGGFFKRGAQKVREAAGKSLLAGILFFAAVLMLITILLSSVIAAPIGILMILLLIVLLFSATAILSLMLSHWLNNAFNQETWAGWKLIMVAFLIFVGIKIFVLTPVVGPLLTILMVLMCFGALVLSTMWRRTLKHGSA